MSPTRLIRDLGRALFRAMVTPAGLRLQLP